LTRDGRLDVRVSNSTLGNDPAPERRKQLSVTYSVGGRQQQITVNEGEVLSLP
jgi:hypothetical protein